MDDDAGGFGDSDANYETTAIAGNTFDYPFLHGQANGGRRLLLCLLLRLGSGKGTVPLEPYRVVDWILGKQREWVIARGATPPKFKTFSKAARDRISEYCQNGGNLIISGAFVGTDLWDNPRATPEERDWAQQVLKYKWRNNYGAVEGNIRAVASPFPSVAGDYSYYHTLNSESYVVEHPDAIEPADENAFTVFRYSENNLSAGILYKGEDYNSCILGFPIEAIKGQEHRNKLVKNIMESWKD